MIDISKLTKSDKGRAVTYTAGHGDKEFGKISSWNDKFVFVRYHTRLYKNNSYRQPLPGLHAQATSPDDLEFDHGWML